MRHSKLLVAAILLFIVTHVYAQPCVLTCPSNITVDATSPAGAVVNYPSPTMSAACGIVHLIPGGGSTFPIGTTTVHAFSNPVQTIYGLTGTGSLVSFNAATPGTVSSPIAITGLAAGEQVKSIDFRPSTGGLYGLAINSTATLGRLYVINTTTGVATALGASTFSLPGVGIFSIDFNPVVDRIRLVSSVGLNIRLNPDLGTILSTDNPLNPGTPTIADIAYSNNTPLSATTTLYDIDFTTDALYTQSGNLGTLTLVGPLGVDASGITGFDISQLGFAYMQISDSVNSSLYTISLGSGAASLVGAIGNTTVTDIAAAPITQAQTQCSFTVTVNGCQLTCPSNITVDATSPAGAVVNYPSPTMSAACGIVHLIPGGGSTFPIGTTTVNAFSNPVQTIYGLTGTGSLVSFNAATPGTVSSPIAITGLAAGEQVKSTDFRPSTGQLYGLATNSAATLGRLYVINTTTGVATALGASTFSLPGIGIFSIDFNPVVDRIRLVSSVGLNIRLHPDLGTILSTDNPLNPGTPTIADIAYSNNTPLSATTTLYDIDFTTDALYTQSGNLGTLTLVGPLGVDASGITGFDISQLGFAYMQISDGVNSSLYTISLGSGAASLVGAIGKTTVTDIAAAPITQAQTQCSFTVTVNGCQLTCPSNITVDATSPAGAVVNYPSPTMSAACGIVYYFPGSGGTFPIGTTTVHAFINPVQTIYGLTGTGSLVSFNAATPGTVSSPIAITGLAAGEQVKSIDFRPSTGQLYGLATNSAATLGRLYVINTTTGVATALGASTFSLPGIGIFSIDFNPVVDRIRLVSSVGLNIRLHPDLGTILSTDNPLNPGTPTIADIAYSNNTPLSATTTLYDIDFTTDALYTQSGNLGTLTLVGPLGVDASGITGFDISQLGFAYMQIS